MNSEVPVIPAGGPGAASDALLWALVWAYVLVVVATFALAGRSLLGRRSSRATRIFWSWLVAGELLYMLRAPACVYLPRSPGVEPVERLLLGSTKAGLYWLERPRDLAFAAGPRWWLYFNPHLLVPLGGFEWLPPLRFAKEQRRPGVVCGPNGFRMVLPLQGPVYDTSEVVDEQGNLVGWSDDDTSLYRYSVSERRWTRIGDPLPQSLGQPVAFLARRNRFAQAFDTCESYGREKPSALIVVERDEHGRELRRSEPIPSGTCYWRGEVALAEVHDDLAILHTWYTGPGMDAGQVTLLSRDLKPLGDESAFSVDTSLHTCLAISGDGKFYTTGQAVFRFGGEKVTDISPPFSSCSWIDSTLYGLRDYPFFLSVALRRHVHFTRLLVDASDPFLKREPRLVFDDYVGSAHDAMGRSDWIRGGFDESGRGDEIVALRMP